MTLPIRAFLIVRIGPDDWVVNVCRDWEAILDAWTGRQNVEQAAVLHFGFDRPASAEFEAAAYERPGRLLVTGSARFGLPRGFEASNEPVGVVAGIPIHLGTRGWGYTLGDGEIQATTPPVPVKTVEASGWVAGFRNTHPDVVEMMDDAGIFDEETYLKSESTLPLETRRLAGTYRYLELVGGSSDDPSAVARAAPPWLAQRPVATMDTTVRVANVCVREGIKTVEDLQRFDLQQLLHLANFGRKSVRDLRESLLIALGHGPVSIFEGTGTVGQDTLASELDRLLAVFDGRVREIFSRRLGLMSAPESLKAIGDDYGLTRERIRQIESLVIKRLRNLHWGARFKDRLKALFASRDFPMPVIGVEAVDRWFAGVSARPELLRYLLEHFGDGRLGIVTVDSVDYVGLINEPKWERALSQARGILKAGSSEMWTEAQCRAAIGPLIAAEAREFRILLWEKSTRLCHFSKDETGRRVLVAYGRGADQVVEAVLMDAERPLHYTEIAERASIRQGRPIEVRRAHNAAFMSGILLGRGTYGLEKHLNLGAGDANLIREEVEAVVLSGPTGRQWHTSEICSALLERDLPSPAFNKYAVDFLLRGSKALRRLGRMTWVESQTGDGAAPRIDIRQATIALVEGAGHPLTSDQIRQQLVALRGVNETFQVVAVDPLIQIGPSLWGLNDRDLSIKRVDQVAMKDDLVEVLLHKGKGIHMTEISQAVVARWSTIPPRVIFGLATSDARMRISGGQYLYLEAWGNPRRVTVLEAIRSVLNDATGPLTFDEIAALSKGRMERELQQPVLSTCLQALGARFDPSSRTWVLQPGDLDEGDDDDDELAIEASLT